MEKIRQFVDALPEIERAMVRIASALLLFLAVIKVLAAEFSH